MPIKQKLFKNMRKGRIAEHIRNNKMTYIILTISFFAGGIAGIIRALSLPTGELTTMKDYINAFFASLSETPLKQSDVFAETIWNNVKIFILIFIFSLHQLVTPVEFVVISIKGFAIFFTAASIIRIFGGKGVLFALTSLFPQIIIVIPAFIAFIVIYMNLAKERKAARNGQPWQKFFTCSAVFAAITISISALEAIISPVFIKSISGFFI